MADRVAGRVKEVATEEAERLKKLGVQAARSGAYFYPIQGILYYLSHRALWRPLLTQLVPTLSLGVGVTAFMFVFTYLPQAALMTFTQGPLAAISAAILVLSESSTIFTMLARTFLIQDALTDTFDAVLVSKGSKTEALVSTGRQIDKRGGDAVARLGKLIKKPFAKYSPAAIIKYFMYLPLNFIPVLGTIAFVILQGRRVGPARHERYFQLKQWNATQREKHIEEFQGAYTSFGIVATILELVPVASILFAFTNNVGAALWAADMERKETGPEGTSPALRDQAAKVEL